MFKLMTDELVRTLCSDRNTLGLGQCVIPAASIHEAAFVKLGTFVIKRQPSYPWQAASYEYLAPLGVKLKKSKHFEHTTVLCDSYKAMDMQTSVSVNVATLQFLGLSGSSTDKYSLECHLGKVSKMELDENDIKN
ncbi:uncharacterized protein LOC142344199 isoform X2 [Convolutriloba macropyga]|uniref:uncharacterized protein LOC142344199 isoform X2 n=1 Tax=Convolutriloba macropyga TaxID=536237 RepID=UPI003F5234F3